MVLKVCMAEDIRKIWNFVKILFCRMSNDNMAVTQNLYFASGLTEITNEPFKLGMWNVVQRHNKHSCNFCMEHLIYVNNYRHANNVKLCVHSL